MIKLTLDQWIAHFKPRPNHIANDHGCDFGEGSCLYETHGPELHHIRSVNELDSRHIWALVEADGEQFITEGFHTVNRLGYLVTETPYNPDIQYQVDYSEFAHDHITVCIKSHDGLTTEQREALIAHLDDALQSFANAMQDGDTPVECVEVTDDVVHIARISGANGDSLFVHRTERGLRRQLFAYVQENWDTLENHLDETIAVPDAPEEAIDLYFEKCQQTPYDEYLEDSEITVGR